MGLRRAGRALAGWLAKQRLERASNPGRVYAGAHASHRLGAQKNRLSVGRFWPGSPSAAGHMNSSNILGSSYHLPLVKEVSYRGIALGRRGIETQVEGVPARYFGSP